MMSSDSPTGMVHIKKEEDTGNCHTCSPSNSTLYSPTLQSEVIEICLLLFLLLQFHKCKIILCCFKFFWRQHIPFVCAFVFVKGKLCKLWSMPTVSWELNLNFHYISRLFYLLSCQGSSLIYFFFLING